MNPAVQAVICGRRRQQVTQTFTGNATWPAPLTTSRIETASGYGGRGTNGTPSNSYIYETQTIYQTRRSDGVREVAYTNRYLIAFNNNSAYCNAVFNTPSDPTYSSNQTCYTYDGFFTSPGTPATAGASTTAFGKTFQGSTGNVTPATTTFSAVAITSGASYSIVVPTGGSLTITYFK